MSTSRYPHKITICRNVPAVAGDGQPVETESQLYWVWGKAKPLTGRERNLANQQQATVTWRVWMPSDSRTRAITEEDWLLLSDGTRLNVVRAFDPTQRRKEVELECVERK